MTQAKEAQDIIKKMIRNCAQANDKLTDFLEEISSSDIDEARDLINLYRDDLERTIVLLTYNLDRTQ